MRCTCLGAQVLCDMAQNGGAYPSDEMLTTLQVRGFWPPRSAVGKRERLGGEPGGRKGRARQGAAFHGLCANAMQSRRAVVFDLNHL